MSSILVSLKPFPWKDLPGKFPLEGLPVKFSLERFPWMKVVPGKFSLESSYTVFLAGQIGALGSRYGSLRELWAPVTLYIKYMCRIGMYKELERTIGPIDY